LGECPFEAFYYFLFRLHADNPIDLATRFQQQERRNAANLKAVSRPRILIDV
jgi:hypothetical protein